MMKLPPSLSRHQSRAETLIKDGKVWDVVFSGSTYQVLVEDKWAFLQLDDSGMVKDFFCSCDQPDSETGCVHLAAALLRIYQEGKKPLHQRFRESFWNRIGEICERKEHRSATGKSRQSRGLITLTDRRREEVLHLQGIGSKGKALIEHLFIERGEETEETSLKFSNLSEEELNLWRKGQPSDSLRYELSGWSDLAKWMLEQQEKGRDYRIILKGKEEAVPNSLEIGWDELVLSASLEKEELALLIPLLPAVKTAYKVYQEESDRISRLLFDPEKGNLRVERKEREEEPFREGVEFDGWIFDGKESFYSRDSRGLLKKDCLEGKEIVRLFEKYPELAKEKLEGAAFHEEPVPLHYTLFFDRDWNLHLRGYLFEPGDLSREKSRYFGRWAYLEGDGFYQLLSVRFDPLEKVVERGFVSQFIWENRNWLETKEGFSPHIGGIESQIDYSFDSQELRFHRIFSGKERGFDFGHWLYVEGEGFFPKTATSELFRYLDGVKVPYDIVPEFIRKNRDELKMIQGFFTETCPIEKAGLSIALRDRSTIFVEPVYHLKEGVQEGSVSVLEEFVFVEDQGFYELPGALRLPERYREPQEIEDPVPFIEYELPALEDVITRLDTRLTRPRENLLTAADLNREGLLYTAKMEYRSELGEASVSSVWPDAKKKNRFAFTDAGLFDLEEDRFKWLKMLDKKQIDRRGNKLVLSAMELIRLYAIDPFETLQGKELFDDLLDKKIESRPDLTGLKSALRPYQELGVQWLWYLYCHGMSGLLCDDMGLGKTHQAMALLAAASNEQREKKHFLIICPTSVIYHWEEKLETFLPKARVCTFHGANRSLEDFHHEYDILLTSYGIWRNEFKLLEEVPFEIAVFDEIQAAKSRKSHLHKALLHVNSQVKIGLTGTPIENYLIELKNLFDLILPSYMPPEQEYKRYFQRPIEKEGDERKRRLLSRMVSPFILRRKKRDVLLELPEKIEQVEHCDLSSEQRTLYNDVLRQGRDSIFESMGQSGEPIPFMHIFAVLSALKQICNHPAAYLKEPESFKKYQSGKWDLFTELLSEAMESRQKVVVFTQYLAMMEMIELYLQERGVDYAMIRGSTRDRGEQVRRFNRDPDCAVFIGSLQAAGLGIDLTAASVVIHYDRWWNAAREDQATDRVHRIGQTRGVQVFKLVTIGTFEERIDQLIRQKGKLMEEVVAADDHRFLKHFDREEIGLLLREVEEDF